ncbi:MULTISPECIES: peptide ABC transporter substrate-binding protein [Bacillus]|mgnify:CR=1 FL=1|jgi:oligopeptide transport system substrate-binding protein|uniref:Periplasmic oligopeptide-binding protein OppA n=2 Tax=Bacillus cereus group TaxID=86661 RepID=Q73A32_BACC1|nr:MULTISPECIES: peptide ABC transporter substrate-binding protein [Bacillus]AAS40878.1 oligopeptide ABC transporter, oligopeptide-binding protein [Bacillus cereus ATCC 10987]KMQ36636.1 peptide ABC transporter substrate-binding protein [Bacillus cereus]KXY78000.1 peptide ABC transporter substrate-binding protein [Bacillus cereus]MCU5157809.1 peptide ABC transporter substrate-binding protein [Bacillus pacificus]MCU9940870.1 peptide ABC transporter substrate-binding protein [Bacillus pacificus]
MKRKKSHLMVMALVTSLLLTACNNKANKSDREAKKQVLNVTVSEEIPSLDTAKTMDGTSAHVMQNIFEGLYVLDDQDQPIPAVAKSFKRSEDGKKYTFDLRKDAKWSNGDSVTANDFLFAWKRAINPETASQYAYMLFYVKNAKEINKGTVPLAELGVKVINDYKLEVELEQPIPYFLQLLALPIYLPQHESFLKEQGKNYALEPSNLIYNGPFVLEKWKHEQEFQLKKNATYWDEKKVKLDEINFQIVKDTMTAVNLYEAGNLDRVPINSQFVDKYKGHKELHMSSEPAIAMLRFNEKNSALANKKVRQAISFALNKEDFVAHFINNGAKPATGLVPVGHINEETGKDFREENGNLSLYDVQSAKKIWEEAKKELGVEQVNLEFLTFEQDNAKRMAEYIKGDLEKNLQGLTIQIKQQPFKQKLQLEQTGDYDITMANWGPDYKDPISYLELFTTGNQNNKMNYSNRHYDELIKKAKSDLVLDQKKRWEALQEAERILLGDAAVAPLYQMGSAYVQNDYVKGIEKHQFGGIYTYKNAYIANE